LATTPTLRPSMRASAVTMFRAQRGLISNVRPSSTIAPMTLCTSYAWRGLSGMTSSSVSSRRSNGSVQGLRGGFSPQRWGK
jgi:hypothetical protein